ncbi:CAAX prenyl protease [Desmophyllum pertusum]|uniref:CAAX prenyl protease 2 n=1 Tax=Desmophyllum pertusum TaxID=174260 RepID=A0A9X0CKU8_9CNID|nr:CAAX prenyl protease [Desmophyllum pertusum]
MADLLDHIGPFVSFSTITRFRGIISCLVLSVAYVGSLYVLKSPYPRDHPKTIRQRFRSVFVISLLAPLYVWLWADGTSDLNILSLWKYLGIHLENILIAILFPLILTAAPLTEEFVYRACLVPMLVPSFGNVLPIFICPLFFGVVFQFGYTTVFGGYTAFLFLRTGHLIGPVLCHSFCNFMGFPPIDQVPSSKYPRLISGSFVAGLVLFLVLAVPLTNPSGTILYIIAINSQSYEVTAPQQVIKEGKPQRRPCMASIEITNIK